MNNDFSIYIKRAGGQDRLTAEDKRAMRARLENYMAYKPIRQESKERARLWFFAPRPVALALACALFSSSAGVSYAAQNALPGDALYGVKIYVNEPVQGALAMTPPAKAAWATSVAGTRVQEAAELAAEGRLSSTTEESLQQSFDAHAQTAIAAIAEVASTSPGSADEVAVSFDAQLSAYQQLLAQVTGVSHEADQPLALAISQKRTSLLGLRASTTASLEQASSSEKGAVVALFARAASAHLADTKRLAQDATDALSSSSAASIENDLATASSTLSGGQALLSGKDSGQAISAFQKTLAAAEQLKVFLRTSAAIHARSGLVIDTSRESDVHDESGKAHALRAESTTQPVASTTASTTPATSTTPTTASSPQRQHGGGHADTDDDTLQLSLPQLP